MMRVTVGLCLLATARVVVGEEVAAPKGEVMTLNDEIFDTMGAQHEIMLVNFYADWCRFSQMLKPIFAAAARQMEGEDSVLFGSIDCEAGDTAVSRDKYHINKYPTIKVYRRGVVLKAEYRGQRSPNAMEAFIKELIASAVAEVHSDEEISQHIERSHRGIVGYFDNSANPMYSVLNDVAGKLRDECHFLAQMESGQAGEGGATIQFKSTRESENLKFESALPSGDPGLADELYTWVREHCNPMVREITFDNGEELTEEGLPFLILFYSPDDHAPVDEFTKIVKERFTEQRGRVNFITADGHKFSHPLRHLGKTKQDLPVLALDTFKHMYLFRTFKNIRVPGRLEAFIEDLHTGRIHQNFHHPPEKQPEYEKEYEEEDNKPDTLKEKLADAEKEKRPDVVASTTKEPKPKKVEEPAAPAAPADGGNSADGDAAPAEAAKPAPHADEHEDETEEEMSKPVAVKSILKNLKPSQNRYSFAHNRDEL